MGSCGVTDLTRKLLSVKARGCEARGPPPVRSYLRGRGLRCSSRSSCSAVRLPWMASQPGLNTE